MTRAGLELGGGGVVGQAYHSGVLSALKHDLGRLVRRAQVDLPVRAGDLLQQLEVERVGLVPAGG